MPKCTGFGLVVKGFLLRPPRKGNTEPPTESLEVDKPMAILLGVYFRWTPHRVIVTIRDKKDYIRVLLYSYYTTITGWGSY